PGHPEADQGRLRSCWGPAGPGRRALTTTPAEPASGLFERVDLLREGEPKQVGTELRSREERRTRHGGNADLFDQPARRGHVVGLIERGEVRHHVVLTLRRIRREPGLSQDAK